MGQEQQSHDRGQAGGGRGSKLTPEGRRRGGGSKLTIAGIQKGRAQPTNNARQAGGGKGQQVDHGRQAGGAGAES